MPARLVLVVCFIALTLGSCGGTGSSLGNSSGSGVDRDGSTTNTGKRDGGGTSVDAGRPDPTKDGGSISGCTPKTCAQLGAGCGPVADGCGGIVECGSCGKNEFCGLNTPNVCGDVTAVCDLAPPSCGSRECGLIGNGCYGSVDCGKCASDEICGLKAPFQCDPPPPPDTNNCPAKITSCASVGKNCGQISNGCGGSIDCTAELGPCPNGQECGLGGANVCGAVSTCTPLPASTVCPGHCGTVSNGCGGTINCQSIPAYACPSGETCGGGGVANACGKPGTQVCTPPATSTLCAGKCGKIGDGCGNVVDCSLAGNGGTTCTGIQSCGAGGTPNVCGQAACQPVSQATACADKCGQVSDGCSSTYDCGGCTNGKVCGLFTSNTCDTPVCSPIPESTACANKCGKVGDGCGNVYTCGASNGGVTCGSNTYCGGGGTANVCGAPACTPATSCGSIGFTCGTAPNGCGGTLDCGGAAACGLYETCTGVPATCVAGSGGGGSNTCPLCQHIPTCSNNTKTVIKGRVTTPDSEVGVPNAFVYIMKTNDLSTLPAIREGVAGGSCERCADEDLGPVLSSALTNHKGEYQIEVNIPVGSDFTLVVKAGKFRRAALVPNGIAKSCQTVDLSNTYSRLPANKTDGLAAHLPKIAISTGMVDQMECVFYKAGIAEAEFTGPSGSGRIHMYRSVDVSRGDGPAGGSFVGTGCSCNDRCTNPDGNVSLCNANTASGACDRDRDGCFWGPGCDTRTSSDDTNLFGSQSTIDGYDLVVFDCEGARYDEAAAADARVREYVNKGGRLFASHWSYSWLYDNDNGPNVATNAWETGVSQSADWTGSGNPDTGTGLISLGRPRANATKIQTFAKWLDNESTSVGVTYQSAAPFDAVSGSFPVIQPRDLVKSANVGTEEWVYRDTGGDTSVQQLSFNTPFGASSAKACGRVAYSGFHVSAAKNNTDAAVFPCVCGTDPTLTDQEKVLLYMLFDLGACVSTSGPEKPTCTKLTQTAACTGKCGVVSDGCGGVYDCGLICPQGQICNATTNQCVNQCTPRTCASLGANCGYASDGCGGIALNAQGQQGCGACASGQICGIFQDNVCGQPVCTPLGQSACTGKCGSISNGCGGVLDCGGCPTGQVCGGGGAPNVCGADTCKPLDCAAQHIGCGMAGNGCGQTIECQKCTLPDTCGGGGVASQCGHPSCTPLKCADVGAQCGFIGDGCGLAVDCGPCPNNGVCGGAGPNKCGGGCTKLSCADIGAECGLVGDGCGALVNCGPCPTGKTCGAVAANRCGDGPACTPLACSDVGAECGLIGDGCGNALDCGSCVQPQTCGGAGTPNKCGMGSLGCTPLTCAAQRAECGAVGDGCGGLLNCGSCQTGSVCGGDGKPNQCSIVVQ